MFHISLLYFAIGQNKGAIYHGKTIIQEIDSQERLSVHIKNADTGQTFDATDIMPAYFFISIPLFNDHLEREIDDWLHVMKYDEVPTSYHSPYMMQVAEKLSILKMTAEERANYSYYRKKLHNDRDELLSAEARGEHKKAIAIEMVKANLALDLIHQLTKLPRSTIERIKKERSQDGSRDYRNI